MKWISVKDRLPEHMQEVLAYTDREHILQVQFIITPEKTTGIKHIKHHPETKEFLYDGWELIEDVTHWMPLPRPPDPNQHFELCSIMLRDFNERCGHYTQESPEERIRNCKGWCKTEWKCVDNCPLKDKK